jgi:hypothetical protein
VVASLCCSELELAAASLQCSVLAAASLHCSMLPGGLLFSLSGAAPLPVVVADARESMWWREVVRG